MAGRGRRGAIPGGFTLIEIVLVLLLFSVAGALVAPALWPALESVRSEAAARRAAAFLDGARLQAVLQRQPRAVRCLPDENRLALVAGEEEVGGFALPGSVQIASCRPDQVRYFPQGFAGAFELELRDPGREGRRITVGAFTGLARVERIP